MFRPRAFQMRVKSSSRRGVVSLSGLVYYLGEPLGEAEALGDHRGAVHFFLRVSLLGVGVQVDI